MTRAGVLVALAAILLAGPVAVVLGQQALSGEALERRVREIADQLRCPTCQAISVRDSEAAFSRQIRDKVRSMLAEGQTVTVADAVPPGDVLSINTPEQLAEVDAILRARLADSESSTAGATR